MEFVNNKTIDIEDEKLIEFIKLINDDVNFKRMFIVGSYIHKNITGLDYKYNDIDIIVDTLTFNIIESLLQNASPCEKIDVRKKDYPNTSRCIFHGTIHILENLFLNKGEGIDEYMEMLPFPFLRCYGCLNVVKQVKLYELKDNSVYTTCIQNKNGIESDNFEYIVNKYIERGVNITITECEKEHLNKLKTYSKIYKTIGLKVVPVDKDGEDIVEINAAENIALSVGKESGLICVDGYKHILKNSFDLDGAMYLNTPNGGIIYIFKYDERFDDRDNDIIEYKGTNIEFIFEDYNVLVEPSIDYYNNEKYEWNVKPKSIDDFTTMPDSLFDFLIDPYGVHKSEEEEIEEEIDIHAKKIQLLNTVFSKIHKSTLTDNESDILFDSIKRKNENEFLPKLIEFSNCSNYMLIKIFEHLNQ